MVNAFFVAEFPGLFHLSKNAFKALCGRNSQIGRHESRGRRSCITFQKINLKVIHISNQMLNQRTLAHLPWTEQKNTLSFKRNIDYSWNYILIIPCKMELSTHFYPKSPVEKFREKGAQLVILWGRRRVGKTYLLKEFCSQYPAIYFLAVKSSKKDQLFQLSEAIAEFFNDSLLMIKPFSDWQQIFV